MTRYPALYKFASELPPGWCAKRLKSICSYISDGSHFSPKLVDNGEKYITVSNVYNNTIHLDEADYISYEDFLSLEKNGCRPKTGDILLAKDGTVGRSAIVVLNDFVALSSLGIIRPNHTVNNEFLKYSLDAPILQEQMKAAMAGSALQRITIQKISELLTVVPPIAIQHKIVEYLNRVCPKIDEHINQLESKRKNYVALRKKLIIKLITHGINPNSSIKETELGWIPNIPSEWKIIEIKTYCKAIYAGATPSTDEDSYWDGNIPWIPSGSCQNCDITVAPKHISQNGFESCSTKFIPRNTTVMAMTGATCSNVGYLTFDACANQSVVAFVENEKICYSRFLFYLLQAAKSYILTFQTGGAQAGINVEECRQLKVPFVPLKEQILIANYLDKKCYEIDHALSEIDKRLKKEYLLKSSLLNDVISGKRKI